MKTATTKTIKIGFADTFFYCITSPITQETVDRFIRFCEWMKADKNTLMSVQVQGKKKAMCNAAALHNRLVTLACERAAEMKVRG